MDYTSKDLLYKVENNKDIEKIQLTSGKELKLKGIDTKTYWYQINNTGRFAVIVPDEYVQGLEVSEQHLIIDTVEETDTKLREKIKQDLKHRLVIVNDDGETEEIDVNGYKFSDLPECFQNAIKEYSFTICYTDNADQEEQADTFYNLNNGQALNAATMNRVKAKSKEQIINLGKHKLFADALSQTALDGHVNEDMVAKAHAILNDKEVSTDAKWIRPYMRKADITKDDELLLTEVFDRIYNIHTMIEDKKIAKKDLCQNAYD